MTSKRSTLPLNAESLRRMLAEKEALLGERETQLAERDRLIAVRDAELYAKTLQIEHLKAQLAVLRRTRFGRSSEKLDREIEQLELLLGELEEGVAERNARAEQAEQEPASPRRAPPGEQKPDGPKAAARASAARAGDALAAGSLQLLRRHGAAQDRRGRDRGAGIRSVRIQGDPARAAEAELPGLRDDRAGAAAVVADRARPAGPGASRGRRRGEIRRWPAAASPERDLCP